MKLFDAILFIIFCHNIGFCLSDWKDGFIITTKDDTIIGQINHLTYKTMGEECKFRVTPLEYDSWNNGATISNYSKRPEINPALGSSAAGFYQAMVHSFVGTDFSPQSQDKFAVNLLTSKSYKAALSGNMTDFKSAASGRWTSLKHWKASNLQTTFIGNRANELIGASRIATPVGSTVALRGTLKIIEQ